MNLTASNLGFLTTFSGWSGASNSTGAGTSFVVKGPVVVASSSQYNYFGIFLVLALVSVAAALAVLALTRRRSSLAQSSRHPTGQTR